MKFASLRAGATESPAVIMTDGRALNIAKAIDARLLEGPVPTDIVPLLDNTSGMQGQIRHLLDRVAAGGAEARQLEELDAITKVEKGSLGPPVRPRLILACSMAYKDHMEEMNVAVPTEPGSFVKSPNTLIGPDDSILLPTVEPELVDFECELTIIFGKRCFNVTEPEALSYVAGYTMVNDVGSRVGVTDWIKSLDGADNIASANLYHRFIRGKQFPTFCPIGPVVVTADEIPDLTDVNVGTRLNGEVMQAANTKDLIFRIAYSIAYFSRWYEFMPGDALTTGSPSGVGFSRTPPVLLRPGDVIEVYADHIGSLFNTVAAA